MYNDENNQYNPRPRFDPKTGERIHYDDENTTETTQAESSEYRYSAGNIPFEQENNNTSYYQQSSTFQQDTTYQQAGAGQGSMNQQNGRQKKKKDRNKDGFGERLAKLAGSAAVSLILTHRSITDCLAVGSGFGYYSLSSIFITEYKGAELGTIALLANISREILTLLAAPLLVRWFGNLAPISAGGATTMDTTLPIITRTAGQQFVVVSIFHGFVVDFSVPFLVTLFCSI